MDTLDHVETRKNQIFIDRVVVGDVKHVHFVDESCAVMRLDGKQTEMRINGGADGAARGSTSLAIHAKVTPTNSATDREGH